MKFSMATNEPHAGGRVEWSASTAKGGEGRGEEEVEEEEGEKE